MITRDTLNSLDFFYVMETVMQRRARWEGGELRKLQGKIKSLEQVNAALQAQLSICQRLPTSQEVRIQIPALCTGCQPVLSIHLASCCQEHLSFCEGA